MKSALFLGLAGLGSANIIFNHIQLTCDPSAVDYVPGLTGCLRGQKCTEEGLCKVTEDETLYPQSFRHSDGMSLVKRAFSTDGKCGPSNGGLLCDPDATAYTGTCCSEYGWCGNDAAHCGTGCTSGCTQSGGGGGGGGGGSTTPRSDGRCGKDFGGSPCDANGQFGGCCSEYGYCGKTSAYCGAGCQSGCDGGSTPSSTTGGSKASTTQEPVIGKPTTTDPAGGGAQTKDGTCGANYDNTVCGNWPNGACCSMYGYCGNTTAHCGDGCQSGPCKSTPVQPAPGPSPAPANPNPGTIKIVGQSGVPPMHAGLMENGRVFFLDKVENYTQLKLSNGQYAYSSEYDPATNKAVALSYKTNAFCSGGAFLPDGRMLSIGGNAPLDFIDPTVGDGFKAIRYLKRSSTDASLNGQGWSEPGNKINTARWYASAQVMPDGTIFVASGSLNGLDPTKPENNNPTYEVLNNQGVSNGKSIKMDILVKNQPYYMYPFLHLLSDGNVFVFAQKSSQTFNVAGNKVVKNMPDLPGDPRTYPNTGGSVLLPLTAAKNWAPEVMICGGGAYQDINSPTDPSCGRIQPLSATPKWEMDSMPEGRGMVEGTLLPNGDVIWVNGCNLGAQGFGLAKNPTYEVLIYRPTDPLGKRWTKGPSSSIARLYHSVALLLLDGTLMIAGSNPVEQPVLKPVPNQTPSEDYVTEFRVENYVPPYLSGTNAGKRPTGVTLSTKSLAPAKTFTVSFTAPASNKAVKVVIYHGGYVTHSVHMNHRSMECVTSGYKAGATAQKLTVTVPPNHNVIPPNPYVVYVVVDGVPSVGQWITVA